MGTTAIDMGLEGDDDGFLAESDRNPLASFSDDEIEVNFADTGDDDPTRTEAQAQPPGDDDEDLSNYSQSVRKRIERERRLKREARERADNNERIIAEERATRQRLEAELAALRQTHTTTPPPADTADIDKEIAAKVAKYKAVRAEFDPDKSEEELDLVDEIQQLREKKRKAAATPATQTTGYVQPATPPPPPLPAAANRWIERNSWFSSPEHAVQRDAAIRIDTQMRQAGHDPNTDNYYAELDRQLKRHVVLPTAKRDNGASAAAAPPTGTASSKRSITLDRSDIAFMRKIGMDPQNPVHVKNYAREKVAALREEA